VGGEKPGGDLHVVVGEDEQVSPGLEGAPVAGGGRAAVGLAEQGQATGDLQARQGLGRRRLRAVVDDDDLEPGRGP
jgi:hypothetical protein